MTLIDDIKWSAVEPRSYGECAAIVGTYSLADGSQIKRGCLIRLPFDDLTDEHIASMKSEIASWIETKRKEMHH